MKPALTRCGYCCDLCLAYQPNVERNPANQQKLSDAWYEYFGFRIKPEEILCDGCMADHPKLIDRACQVRPCVIVKGLGTCVDCDETICAKLKERIVVYEEVRGRFGRDIPEHNRTFFIRPYEYARRLEIYRKSGEIVE